MKKILVAVALVVSGVSVPAMAADMDTTSSSTDWSGKYLGVHGGYGFGSQDWTLIDNPGEGIPQPLGEVVANPHVSGVLGGAQAGINWQRGNIVFGLEGEFSFSGINGSEARFSGGEKPGPREWSSEMNWLAMVGPRLGYASGNTLFYAKGGLAIANQDAYHLGAYGGPPVVPAPDPAPAGRSYENTETQYGMFIGAGIEQAFSSHWSGKVEYNYLNLSNNVELWGKPDNSAIFGIDQGIHVVKVGLNYRFGG